MSARAYLQLSQSMATLPDQSVRPAVEVSNFVMPVRLRSWGWRGTPRPQQEFTWHSLVVRALRLDLIII
jgi:hypothetical protein